MKQYDIPILLVIFNRTDTTLRILKEIKKVRPREIFIVADGPRTKEEKEKTDLARKTVLDFIDWPCKVSKKFRKENWGCDKSSVDGLNWFFENVERGIFLEDDCLPSESFFEYHRELLKKYEGNDNIKAICSVNFFGSSKIRESYLFSARNFSGWGFSTWKRAWGLDKEFVRDKYEKNMKKMFPNFFQRLAVKRNLDNVFYKNGQGWDFIFASKNILLNGLMIFPKNNLIESIGFDGTSTHSFNKIDEKYYKISLGKLSFPMVHPVKILDDKKFNHAMSLMSVKKYVEKSIYNLKNTLLDRVRFF